MANTKDTRNRDSDKDLFRHTGSDAIIKFQATDALAESADGDVDDQIYEIPVTNVNWTSDYTHEEIQHNGSLSPTLAPSEIRYSGSFEWEGHNPKAMQLLTSPEAGNDVWHVDRMRPTRFKLTVREFNHGGIVEDSDDLTEQKATFLGCLAETVDRDLSAGEVSSTTIDFGAEKMYLWNENGVIDS